MSKTMSKASFVKRVKARHPDAVRSTDPMTELHNRWDDNIAYKTLRSLIDTVDLDTLDDQAEAIAKLHTNRRIRDLPDTYSLAYIRDVAAEETSYRSRIVGIIAKRRRLITRIEIGKKALKLNISAAEYQWLQDNIKASSERNHLVEALLSEVDLIIGELQALIDFAQDIITDIDKAAYLLKNVIHSFELEMKSEHTYRGK